MKLDSYEAERLRLAMKIEAWMDRVFAAFVRFVQGRRNG